MEDQTKYAASILEELKKSLLENNLTAANRYAEAYEKLRAVDGTLFSGMRKVFLYLKNFEKAQHYYNDDVNPYDLGRFYLYFGQYDRASSEFIKWASTKDYPWPENQLLVQILFVQGEYQKLVNLLDNRLNTPWDQRPTIMKLLTIALICLSKSTSFVEFEDYFKRNHLLLYQSICDKVELKNIYVKNYLTTKPEKIEKIKTKICSFPDLSLNGIISEIDYFIEHGKNESIYLINIYEDDPIMMRVKEQFTPSIKIKNAFTLFENIVHNEINSKIDYESKYQLDGLIDYYLLSKDYTTALKLLRKKNNKGVHEFVLLINLLLLTDNDITAADFFDWQYLFFGNPLSKLVLSIKEDFIVFVDKKINEVKKNENRKFIDTLKKGLIYFPPYHPQNPPLLTEIGNIYRTIYKSSPLYKSIMSKEIFPASIDLENGSACCQKYFKDVENEFRESLGIRFKEFGSDSEVSVYLFVKKLLPSHTIILQYSPDWLRPQRIDLFIKELNLAIEYQGEQHYRPIEYYGGEKTFKMLENNDKRKYELAKAMEVNLEYIRHDENIETRVNEIVKKYTEK